MFTQHTCLSGRRHFHAQFFQTSISERQTMNAWTTNGATTIAQTPNKTNLKKLSNWKPPAGCKQAAGLASVLASGFMVKSCHCCAPFGFGKKKTLPNSTASLCFINYKSTQTTTTAIACQGSRESWPLWVLGQWVRDRSMLWWCLYWTNALVDACF